jgi:hypothetical protein
MNVTPPVLYLWQEIAGAELTDRTLCGIAKLGTCECLVRGEGGHGECRMRWIA